MAITEGGDSRRVSGPMTPEEKARVDEMNRNLRLTGHTNPSANKEDQEKVGGKSKIRPVPTK